MAAPAVASVSARLKHARLPLGREILAGRTSISGEINIRAATCAIFLAATAKQAPEKPSPTGLVVAQVP